MASSSNTNTSSSSSLLLLPSLLLLLVFLLFLLYNDNHTAPTYYTSSSFNGNHDRVSSAQENRTTDEVETPSPTASVSGSSSVDMDYLSALIYQSKQPNPPSYVKVINVILSILFLNLVAAVRCHHIQYAELTVFL